MTKGDRISIHLGAIYLLVIQSVLFSCSSSKDHQDPCADVLCSGRGVCVLNDRLPACLCDPGLRSVGPYCLKDYQLIVLQTNDRHSHWLGENNCDYDPDITGDGSVGGAARWMPLVKADLAYYENVLLLDAGDFSMGTMLVGAENHAADLNMLKELGFNAAALGNHEFDWGVQRLYDMIKASDDPSVPLLCANMRFDAVDARDDPIEQLYGDHTNPEKRIHPYITMEMPGGFKVGIFGLMGLNATLAINSDPITFSKSIEELAERAQAVVDELRNHHQADVVILLAHLGLSVTNDVIGGETAQLAQLVKGIDVILSGHYHTVTEPVEIAYQGLYFSWTTLAMEAGSRGHYLGRYEMRLDNHEKSVTGELIPITGKLPADSDISARIEALIENVEQNILSSFPTPPENGAFLNGDLLQTLTTTDFDLNRHMFSNNNLGYLATDALAEATGVELAVVGNSSDLRSSLKRCKDGSIDLSDLFNVSPLGIGSDGLLGFPAVVFYMSWENIKTIFEYTLADQGLVDNDYMFNVSGVRIELNTKEAILSRITRIVQYDPTNENDPGTTIYEKDAPLEGWQVEKHALVKLASSYILGQAIQLFPSINILDEYGDPVTDLDSRIVYDHKNRELKLWYLLAEKLASFENGLPNRYNDDTELNTLGPYWRRLCDTNPDAELGHACY